MPATTPPLHNPHALTPTTPPQHNHSCTGPLPNMCTPEHDYGGCWRSTIDGAHYHSCVDDIKTFRWMGQYGITNASTPTFRCQCPPCFRETPSGGCEPACDLGHCLGSDGCGLERAGRSGGGLRWGSWVLGVCWSGWTM
jgi:hypothetical protein